MGYIMRKYQAGLALVILLLTIPAFAGNEVKLCSGKYALLSLINRPTAAYSACTVPTNEAIFEQGLQAQKLLVQGQELIFPAENIRFGLPGNNEFFALLPNYLYQTVLPHTGFTATFLGFKHIVAYTDNWLLSFLEMVVPSSGSRNFGERGFGGSFSAIFTGTIVPSLSITGQFGFSTETASIFYGGQRFNSFDEIIVLSWLIKNNLQFYAEVYGRNHVGPHQGSGFNIDSGFVFLLKPNVTLDIEVGQRLRGQLGYLENYVGAGIVFQF